MRIFAVLLVLTWSAAAVAADTLVVRGEEGIYGPGVASKWWADGPSVHFQVSGADAAESIAAQLTSALAGADIKTKGDVVIVAGIPEPVLLEQLSKTALTVEVDPLADLAEAGVGVVAFSGAEGGGSIRATNPNFALPVGAFDMPKADSRFEAEVLSVEKKEFPRVVLKLKVRGRAGDVTVRKEYRRNSVFTAPVLMTGGDGAIDFDAERTRRNLVAYYLERGDRVFVHAIKDESDRPHIDWIERKAR